MRTIVSILLLCITASFIQPQVNDKPYLFVGLYRVPQVKGPCSNIEMTQVAASTRKEAYKVREAFYNQYKSDQNGMQVMGPEDAAIVYEFEKNEGSNSCTSKIRTLKKGKSIARLQADMELLYEKNPRHYKTKPTIIFTWNGKKL